FETFPFPDTDTGLTPELRERIALLAEQIDAHRKRVLAPEAGNTGLTLTGLYNVLTALRGGRALTAKEKLIHTQGLVGVLRELHDELDAAVLAAYGLPAGASTDDILAHLVQLNTERAQEEAQGRVRWLRPEFQNPQKTTQKQELLAHVNQALEADFDTEKSLLKAEQSKPQQLHPWPATLPEQVRAVAEALARSPAPLTLPALEQQFKGRGPWKRGLPTLLQTLEALGRAQAVTVDGGLAWRA
ncbi:MAG: class I SAM-dependent DNA methyltransferase, partial [Giesbergeria sp.]